MKLGTIIHHVSGKKFQGQRSKVKGQIPLLKQLQNNYIKLTSELPNTVIICTRFKTLV